MLGLPQEYEVVYYHVTQQMTAFVDILQCKSCGSLVADKEQHDKWHALNQIGFG